jgi:beta-1,4-N-acetylglucosaminyltransferase
MLHIITEGIQSLIVLRNLSLAITKAEDFRIKMSQFPPITSGRHRETKSFEAIMDETMGFREE